MEPVPDCVVVVGGELEQSLEEEGRTGAASDRVKVIDWVLPLLIRRYNKTKPHTPRRRFYRCFACLDASAAGV